MKRFNNEGIKKFVGALSGSGLAGMISRFNMLCAADRTEVFYGGKAADATGESKIIFKSGAITVKEEQ